MKINTEKLRKNKVYRAFMTNFKLPCFLAVLLVFVHFYRQLYHARFVYMLQAHSKYFFYVTFAFFAFLSFKMLMDWLSVTFFQKGQNALKEKSKGYRK